MGIKVVHGYGIVLNIDVGTLHDLSETLIATMVAARGSPTRFEIAPETP